MIRSSSAPPTTAQADTWGIAGPDFLTFYLAAAVVAGMAVLLMRRAATRGDADVSETTLPPEQVGYLAGFRTQAYYTALTALRTLGLVTTAGKGTIVATGAPGPRLSELQQAILQVIGQGARTSSVQSDPRLSVPMDRIRDGLRMRGLLLTPAQSARCRRAALLLLAVAAVGLARVIPALSRGRASGYLLLVMFVVGVLGLILLAVVPARTAAGTTALRRLRAVYGHLQTSQNPSWATYGPAGAGLSVALFGATALFAIDPVFADEASVPRHVGSGAESGAMSGADSGGDGGGGSCGGGGGGCGGGCGG